MTAFLLDVNVLIALVDPAHVQHDRARMLNHGQVTDSYLLALARVHGGKLATFDRRLAADSVHGGASALHVL